MAATGLNIVIPRIEQGLDTGVVTAQWVLNGYALAFGVLIVTAGRLADLFGRRRMFIAGGALFALSSAASGLSPDIGVLIGVRCLMAFVHGVDRAPSPADAGLEAKPA